MKDSLILITRDFIVALTAALSGFAVAHNMLTTAALTALISLGFAAATHPELKRRIE